MKMKNNVDNTDLKNKTATTMTMTITTTTMTFAFYLYLSFGFTRIVLNSSFPLVNRDSIWLLLLSLLLPLPLEIRNNPAQLVEFPLMHGNWRSDKSVDEVAFL